jgi:hypothetical protein
MDVGGFSEAFTDRVCIPEPDLHVARTTVWATGCYGPALLPLYFLGQFGRHEAIGIAVMRHMADAGERQMHAGDENPVGADQVERPLATERRFVTAPLLRGTHRLTVQPPSPVCGGRSTAQLASAPNG